MTDLKELLPDIWAVEVPEGNWVSINGNQISFFFSSSTEKTGQIITLPPGNYQFLFTTKDAGEEDWQKVIRAREDYSPSLAKAFDEDTMNWVESLLKSKGLDTTKNYAIIKKQNI